MKISHRIQSVQASGTVKFTTLLQQLKKDGRDIISFAIGEPEYDTPLEVIDATKQALLEQKTKYTGVQGLMELRAALALQFEGYGLDNIVITNGAKQALYTAFQVICNPQDEVIVPRPCWVSFSEQIKLAGAVPVFVDTKDHQLDLVQIKRAVSQNTRAILLNSPNNPTGAVYPENDIRQVVDLAVDKGLYLISDEAYDAFVYDAQNHISPFCFKSVRDQLIVIRSFSKTYHMTGFRVGYLAAPENLARAAIKIQGHLTGNVCTFAQLGALAALSIAKEQIDRQCVAFQKKRDIAFEYAASMFNCIRPQGAFYLFPDVSMHLKKDERSEDFAVYLLEHAGVAVIPGKAFGLENHIRISYAVSDRHLIDGFERIRAVL